MKNETEDIAWISDGPYNYLGGNVNREYMYLGLEPASLTQDAIKTFEAAIDAAALPQSLHYFDMSILGDVLGTPEAGTLYIKAQPSYNFYVGFKRFNKIYFFEVFHEIYCTSTGVAICGLGFGNNTSVFLASFASNSLTYFVFDSS